MALYRIFDRCQEILIHSNSDALPPKGSGLFCAARIALANTLHFRYNVSDNGENGHKQARQLLALRGEIERRIL